MPFAASMKEKPKMDEIDILCLTDENMKPMIRIDASGKLIIADTMQGDEATFRFWQAISDFIPKNHAENVVNKIFLIEAYNAMSQIAEMGRLDRLKDSGQFFHEVLNSLQQHFGVR